MKRSDVNDRVAIVGIGHTDYTRDSGRSELHLAAEAIKNAADDAGLSLDEIDGIVKYSVDTSGDPPTIAATLGLPDLSYWALASGAGSGSCAIVGHAANAVVSGQAKYVVAYRSVNGSSGVKFGTKMGTSMSREVGGKYTFQEFSQPYGLFAPAQVFAFMAKRYMIEYGDAQDAMGQIAVACRSHASRNPNAQKREQFTLEDYHGSRWINEPLHLLDCCLTTDGAAAVIITTAERAHDLKQRPVTLAAWGQAAGPKPTKGILEPWLARDVITETTGRYLAPKLYDMAEITANDIDVAQLYDCFTITALLQMEDYGFCKKGEAVDFIGDGSRITLGGDLPINTAGGNLSEGYIHGFNHVLEGVRQMRGTSTAQVDDAEYCLISGGAPIPTSGLILRKN